MVVVSVVIPFFQRVVFFFPFNLVGEFSPFSHPGLDFATRSLGFFFSHRAPTLVPRREFFFWLLSLGFWFCNFFGNRDEEGKWEGARVCVEGRMGRDAKPTNLLCLCPFLSRKVNQKSRGERWSQSPGKIRSFSPSLSSRLLSNNCYF